MIHSTDLAVPRDNAIVAPSAVLLGDDAIIAASTNLARDNEVLIASAGLTRVWEDVTVSLHLAGVRDGSSRYGEVDDGGCKHVLG